MKKVFVAGHNGMVGSAICRKLSQDASVDLTTVARDSVDLTNQAEVANFFKHCEFDEVYLAAARVGGIRANNEYPAEFIYQNLMIQNNVIDSAYRAGVKKLLFLGSSCIYPRESPQPMCEDALLTGPLEPTNEPYAIAKIAGIKMCESYSRQYGVDYRSVMPTNLYGPGDNFHPENSHVIPALIRRFVEAKRACDASVTVWGSGRPRREFLHVDDMAAASVHVMNLCKAVYESETLPMLSHINVGSGMDCSIKELAETIAEVVEFSGAITWDKSKPDGAPRKLMDSSKLRALGWRPEFCLRDGLADSYMWYLKNIKSIRV